MKNNIYKNIQQLQNKELQSIIQQKPLETILPPEKDDYSSYIIKDYASIKVNLPKQFNGKEIWKSYFNDIENQKNCGSCWAFSTVKTLEDRINIQSKIQPKVNLSPARLILCNIDSTSAISYKKEQEKRQDTSCYGNTIFEGLKYLYQTGTLLDNCLPYDLKNNVYYKPINEFQNIEDLPFCETVTSEYYDMCYNWYYERHTPNFLGTSAKFFRIASFYKLQTEEEMMKDIFLFGPIVSGFDVYEDFYTFDPKKDIYDNNGNGVIVGGHAIEIVGWGEENGKKYWWIKNSWGEEWGIDGYFKMARGTNLGNVESNAWGLVPDFYYSLDKYIPPGFLNKLPTINIERKGEVDIDETGYSKRTRLLYRELDKEQNIFTLEYLSSFYNKTPLELFVPLHNKKNNWILWIFSSIFILILVCNLNKKK